jgi:hypothetical protein
MRATSRVILAGALLPLAFGYLSGEGKVAKSFLLEDTRTNEWCAYKNETVWNGAVQDAGAMTVATLTYSDDHLSQIDVTETDESGDWTVYDHYFLNDSEQIVRLSRMINVLPGDRSVVQTFSISDGKATKTGTTVKQLSAEQPLTSPTPVWLPDLPIRTEPRMFPFFSLLGRPDLRTASKTCMPRADAR